MRVLWLSLLLLASGCRPPATGPVRLARGAVFTLRSPETGPQGFASQEVEVHQRGGETDTLLATVENAGGHLSIVASSPLGMTLFTLRMTGESVALEARVPLPRRFDPRLLPVLIQLAHWPLDELRRGLGPGLDLREEGTLRTLRRGGEILLTLDRKGPAFRGQVRLALPSLGLVVDIRTLEDPS